MTTKKQRRAAVAERAAARREWERLHGLEMQRLSHERREQLIHDAERAQSSRRTARSMRKAHEATEARHVEASVLQAYSNAVYGVE